MTSWIPLRLTNLFPMTRPLLHPVLGRDPCICCLSYLLIPQPLQHLLIWFTVLTPWYSTPYSPNHHLHHATRISIIWLCPPVTRSCSPLFFSTSSSDSFSSTPVIWFSSATFHHCVSHHSLTLHLTSQTYFFKGMQPWAIYLILSILPYTDVHFTLGI